MMENRLRELRELRKLTISELAQILDISTFEYYELEKSKKNLNKDILYKLSDYYEVTEDYILGRTDFPNTVIMEDLPKEIKDLGVDYITVTKELRERGLTSEDITEIIKSVKKIKDSKY